MKKLAVIVLALASGCLVGDSKQGHTDNNIIGGSPDSGDASVVQIRFGIVDTSTGAIGEAACTGTVISPTVLLTAGHCAGGFSYEYNPAQSADPFSNSAGWIAAAAAIANPAYNGDTTKGYDVAVVELVTPTSITPSPLGAAPTAGESVTAVGYGLTQPGTSGAVGTKERKTFPVASVATHEFVAGPEDTCHGDSGGPVFDASGAIVGTTSYGDTSNCVGNDHFMRVDDNLDFLGQYVGAGGGSGGGSGSGGGGGSGSGGTTNNSCDSAVSQNGISEEVKCTNGACTCFVDGSQVGTCTDNGQSCSIPGSCCGF